MADLRLFLLSPEVVFRGRVNMASVTYPVTQITFDNVTIGDYTIPKADMTLRLGSSAGMDDLGRARIAGNAAGTNILRVSRAAEGTRDGELTVSDNAWIDVLEDYRVWAKLPRITTGGEVLKDGWITYTDQNEAVGPVAMALPNAVAGTANGSGVLEVTFSASSSYSLDETFYPISVYSWEVEDGNITVGVGVEESITVEFPPGFRYVKLQVSTAGGQSAYHYIPVYVRDPTNDDSITDFQITEHVIRPNGQRISLKIYQELPRATYPDGTLMMLWEGEPSSASDNTNLLFVGWHHNDEAGVQSTDRAILKDTTLTFLDVAGKLATLPGMPQLLKLIESPDTPNSWEETTLANVRFHLYYLLRWHSTALEVGGLRVLASTPSLELYPFIIKESDADNLYNQANGLCQSVTPDFHLNCTRRGLLTVAIDPMIQDVTNRTATVALALGEDDWYELRYPYQRPPRVAQIRTYAVVGSTGGALACLAPGEAPGQGEGFSETSQRFAASQSGLNIAEGNRYARLNARYGLFTLTMPYSRIGATFEPADLRWTSLTVSAANSPQRGLTLTAQRGLTQEINIRHDYTEGGLVRTATLQWEMETSGPAAVTLVLD